MKKVVALVAVVLTTFIGSGQVELQEDLSISRQLTYNVFNIEKYGDGYIFYDFDTKKINIQKFDSNFLKNNKEVTLDLPKIKGQQYWFYNNKNELILAYFGKDRVLSFYELNEAKDGLVKKAQIDISKQNFVSKKFADLNFQISESGNLFISYSHVKSKGELYFWEDCHIIRLDENWSSIEQTFKLSIDESNSIYTYPNLSSNIIRDRNWLELFDNETVSITPNIYEAGSRESKASLVFSLKNEASEVLYSSLKENTSDTKLLGVIPEDNNNYTKIYLTKESGSISISLKNKTIGIEKIYSFQSSNELKDIDVILSKDLSNSKRTNIIIDYSESNLASITLNSSKVESINEINKNGIDLLHTPFKFLNDRVIFKYSLNFILNTNFVKSNQNQFGEKYIHHMLNNIIVNDTIFTVIFGVENGYSHLVKIGVWK